MQTEYFPHVVCKGTSNIEFYGTEKGNLAASSLVSDGILPLQT